MEAAAGLSLPLTCIIGPNQTQGELHTPHHHLVKKAKQKIGFNKYHSALYLIQMIHIEDELKNIHFDKSSLSFYHDME